MLIVILLNLYIIKYYFIKNKKKIIKEIKIKMFVTILVLLKIFIDKIMYHF